MTAVGFASVYIARQDVISTASLTYAGFFFALYLAAHLVARYTVPFADPYLLPIAGLLTDLAQQEAIDREAVQLASLTNYQLEAQPQRSSRICLKYIEGASAVSELGAARPACYPQGWLPSR